jgi:intracellular sulfur oxidation DsrE/DsrF family protein
MKPLRHLILSTALLAAGTSALAAEKPAAGELWETPAVVGVGKVHPLPQAAYQPTQGETYSVVFSITKSAAAPSEINPSLRQVARMVNLYTSAGVPLSHLQFVAVIYDGAIDATLDDAHYRQKYGVGNPNLPLIQTLRHAGIDVAAGGQSLDQGQGEERSGWLAPGVTLALSGMTAISNLEHLGYVLMPL